jgi:hypothetical protein
MSVSPGLARLFDGRSPPVNRVFNELRHSDAPSVLAASDQQSPLLFCKCFNFAPAAYQRKAPIGSCLYKKLSDLFSPFVNISLKRNLNTVGKGYF